MKKRLIYILCTTIILGIIVGIYTYLALFSSNITVKDDGIIYIEENDDYHDIVSQLSDRGYLRNRIMFNLVAQLKRYPQLIKTGRFRVEDEMSNIELIDRLRRGDQTAINFTFNAIRTIDEFVDVAAKQLQVDRIELRNRLTDSTYLSTMGLTPQTVTSILLPDSYQIYWKPSADKLIERLYGEYNHFWNSKRREKAKEIGLTPIQITTLASIIEEETVKVEEYSIIAGVYINRLKRNIPLAACPTIKYALNDFTLKRILTKHLNIDSPYNTYIKLGLPPGPIRITSARVIDAILNYTPHDYLYFCAKSDFSGRHHFSKTLREHNRYAREYHNALNQQRIYK